MLQEAVVSESWAGWQTRKEERMTKCPRCSAEHEGYCSICREEIAGRKPRIETERLFPVLYVDTETGTYRFGCRVKAYPCNQDGLCVSQATLLPFWLLHE